MNRFSFDELTEIVKSFLDNTYSPSDYLTLDESSAHVEELSEEELESILNATDPDATIVVRVSRNKTRVYNTAIISQMKIAHHIDYFASTHNNDASNIIIICPNHHRLIHKLNPIYIADGKYFEYPNGTIERIILVFPISK